MDSVLLNVQGVNKSFGKFTAVKNISFSIRQGEVLGIAGPNGSGKSTLFNILTALPFAPDSGDIWFNGRSLIGLKPFQIARLGLLRTFQKDSDFKSLSAFDNVMMGENCCKGLSKYEKIDRAQAALVRVAFPVERYHLAAADLSVFEKKLLMIASALVSSPVLLLLDEPASGLTKPEIDALRDLLIALNAQGLTIAVIEHVLPLLMSVSERLIILDEGHILMEGTPEQVVHDERVINAYLGGQAAHAHSA